MFGAQLFSLQEGRNLLRWLGVVTRLGCVRGKFIIRDFLCRIGVDGMKMQIMIHTHKHTYTSPSPSSLPYPLTSSYQGTNGSQLWDSAFAAQAFLEVRTKQGCVVKVHDQRGRGHLQGCHLCVLTSTKAGVYNDRRLSDCTRMKALHWFFSCVYVLYVHVY